MVVRSLMRLCGLCRAVAVAVARSRSLLSATCQDFWKTFVSPIFNVALAILCDLGWRAYFAGLASVGPQERIARFWEK